jgi:hypothetical protein
MGFHFFDKLLGDNCKRSLDVKHFSFRYLIIGFILNNPQTKFLNSNT